MNDKFQILRDFANSNDKPDKDIYQFVKEVLDMNSAYAKENQQLKIQISAREEEYKKLEDNWKKLKEYVEETKIKEFEKSFGKRYGKTFTQAEIIVCNMIKNKIKELEARCK